MQILNQSGKLFVLNVFAGMPHVTVVSHYASKSRVPLLDHASYQMFAIFHNRILSLATWWWLKIHCKLLVI